MILKTGIQTTKYTKHTKNGLLEERVGFIAWVNTSAVANPPGFVCLVYFVVLPSFFRTTRLATRNLLLFLPLLWLALLAQGADGVGTGAGAPGRYEYRQDHSPDGIGKFYLGREIAHMMGHQAADWLERPTREEEEKTQLLVDSLPVKTGEVVADIGAGTGYFSRRLSKKVGDRGQILAVDIQPEMLGLLTNEMAKLHITNVVPILGAITDPKLPAAAVDLVLMVDVYHEFSHPVEMMQNICKSLKPGGRVAFVEFRGEDPEVPIKPLHKMTEAQVRNEMSSQPLEWVETISALPRQHIVIFRRKNA